MQIKLLTNRTLVKVLQYAEWTADREMDLQISWIKESEMLTRRGTSCSMESVLLTRRGPSCSMESVLLTRRGTCHYLAEYKVKCWKGETLWRYSNIESEAQTTRNTRPSLADVARRWLVVGWHPRKWRPRLHRGGRQKLREQKHL
jgi:hypothetical protein